MYPHLGKAGSEYAKSVKPQRAQLGAPPDPGLLFDGATPLSRTFLILALLARKQYKPHPDKISSMLFYLATIIIHGISPE